MPSCLSGQHHEKLRAHELVQEADVAPDPLAAFDGLNQAAMRLAYDLPLPDLLVPGCVYAEARSCDLAGPSLCVCAARWLSSRVVGR